MSTFDQPAILKGRIPLIVSGAILLYLLACAFTYSSYPLALSPQLDAAENLNLAADFDKSLPTETTPFYRAPFYPYLLSLLEPVDMRPLLGLLFGFICHLVNGALVYGLSRKIFNSAAGAILASALYLLNPASIFFSLQILDVTFGISLFLGGIYLIHLQTRSWVLAILGGLLLGLAIAARPHFLPVVLLAPLVLVSMMSRKQLTPLIAYLPIMAVLLTQGFINLQRSGEFQILPWQGAYNLWAANKPGASGLYFKQEVDLSGLGTIENPAKEESIILYAKAHPEEQSPYSIDKMNSYWRGRLIAHIAENPVQVGFLWLKKAYAAANSFEQYNNLSFTFHKAQLPLLKYNPLNWGILFVLGTFGLWQLFRERPSTAIGITLIMLAYLASLLLFYASSRFRLPLVPFMAILAGGSLQWFINLQRERGRLIASIGVAIVTGGLAYSSFAGIRSTDTFIQDRLLMANANADLGRDAEAASWAREVLRESPDRAEAQRIYAISYFNLRLTEQAKWIEFGNWKDQQSWVRPVPTNDPAYATILAFYKWHWGEKAFAINIWEQVAGANPDSPSLAKKTLLVIKSVSAELTPEQKNIQNLLHEE